VLVLLFMFYFILLYFISFHFIDPDEKENGGMDKMIEFPLVNLRQTTYKSALKSKQKRRLFELVFQIKQTKYSQTGNAWKVWDSAIVFSRWIFANSHLFIGLFCFVCRNK
jgi:hypothetical protein